MKNKYVLLALIFLSVTSCSLKFQSQIDYKLGSITYNEEITTLNEIKNIDSMQDLSNFADYVTYYSKNEDYMYTTVSNDYKNVLLNDLEYQVKWAFQYSSIGHNFVNGYDVSKLESDNLIGVSSYIGNFGFKSSNEETNNVITYEYYQDVLKSKKYENKDGNKLPLYQHNNGFVEAINSEQLFYACMNNYFPYCKKGTKAYEILQKAIGILNRIIKDDMNEFDKFRTIYHYLLSENTYDYGSFKKQNSNHQDYACYFLEGVFDHHTAVCDGLSKALVMLSRLEGIEAYHIGAVSKIGGHAYCYVKINGNYYLSCITSGSNIEVKNNIKYHVHNNLFLLTSYYTSSPSWEYDSLAFPNIKEEVKKSEPFPYYDNYYIKIGDSSYSLHIKDEQVGNKILTYIDSLAKKNKLCLQIELLGNYEIMSKVIANYNNKEKLNIVNNGMLQKDKAYTFFFDYRK